MKSSFSYRHRRWIAGAMILLALSVGPRTLLWTSLPAQTAPAGRAAPAGAPGATSTNIDQATGKPIITTDSGLKYVDIIVGEGAPIKTGDHLTCTYVGKLLDGTQFDASANHGGTMDYVQGVTSLIKGWTEGTSTMKVGGERKLIIPPELGYGQEGAADVIPPNATLIFDIKIVANRG